MDRLSYDVNKWAVMEKRWSDGDPLPSEKDTPAQKWEDETFCSLYEGDQQAIAPERRDEKWSRWADRFHALARQNPNYAALQQECNGNLLASLQATDAIYAALAEEVEKEDPDDGNGGGEGDEPQGDGQSPGDGQGKGPADDSDLRKKVNQAIEDATQKVEDAKDMVDGFGPGAGTGTSFGQNPLSREEVKKWANILKNKPHLKKLAQLAGRFRRVAANVRKTSVKHAADEVQDVETGRDLSRMLPSEAMRLKGSRGTRLSWMADYAAGRLMQYRIGGTEVKGQGPVVVCIDKSGSMSGAPDMWATAIALAIMSLAQKDRRPFALIPYNYSAFGPYLCNPGEQIPMDALLVQAGGGTHIDGALDKAFQVIKDAQTDGSAMKKADIIIITDGDCYTYREVLKDAEDLKCKVIGIGIGVPKEDLKPWSHHQVSVPTVSGTVPDEVAEALFTEGL